MKAAVDNRERGAARKQGSLSATTAIGATKSDAELALLWVTFGRRHADMQHRCRSGVIGGSAALAKLVRAGKPMSWTNDRAGPSAKFWRHGTGE